ncbi:MAG: hypothetical protein KC468_16285 [Myxococcales bacterium]|nr:hypothetical protein [Myxococcales bacterium]
MIACAPQAAPTRRGERAAPAEAKAPARDGPVEPALEHTSNVTGAPDVADVAGTPVAADDDAHRCARDEDCMNSCSQGAVSVAWYREAYPGREACEDGCESKGTEPARCEQGACVAYWMGRRNDECTRRPPTRDDRPGPAHSCARDDDCVTDCALGAVNRAWYELDPARPRCKDGCARKGSEAPRCREGLCVAWYRGAPDDVCTRRPVIPLPGS